MTIISNVCVTTLLLSLVTGSPQAESVYSPPADLGLSPVQLPQKESRFIFGYPDCEYQGKLGTCYGSVECLVLAGNFGNFCGLTGLCCLFYRSCGMRTSQKVAYFRNEQYPLTGRVDSTCEMRVIKRSEDYCAVRVRMEEANFPKPSRIGMCDDASYNVVGTREGTAPKCGDLTGETYTYDLRHTGELKLTINSSTLRSGINWNMEIQQVPCSEYNKPENTGTGGGDTTSGSGPGSVSGTGSGTGSGSGAGSGTDTGSVSGPDTGSGSGTVPDKVEGGPTGPVLPPTIHPPAPPTTIVTDGAPATLYATCGIRGPPYNLATRNRANARRMSLLGPLGPDVSQISGRRNKRYPRPGDSFRRRGPNNRRRRPRPNKKSPQPSEVSSVRQQEESVVTSSPETTPAVTTTEWGVPDLSDSLFAHYAGDRSFLSYRITYGLLAGTREFPWQVGMTVNGKFHCGACIVGEQWILTAAHCVISYKNTPDKIDLTVGDWDLNTVNDGPHKKVKVKSVIVHPNYSSSTLQNDLALLKLTAKIEYTDDIQPICLPTTDINLAGERSIVSGWGRNEKRLLQPQLHYLEAKVLSNVICESRWHANGAPRGFIVDSMMCMDSTNGDSCNGDSGGPSVTEYPKGSGNYVLVGLVSFGSGSCTDATLPGVYTRVAYYRQWIQNNMI